VSYTGYEINHFSDYLVLSWQLKSTRLRCARRVARMGEMRNAYRILVRKPLGTCPIGRPRRRWMDNIG
jgi:hypothetical protein